jgi:hypothetical protein
MNIEYTWEIETLEKQNSNTLEDIVVRVRYKYIGTDVESNNSFKFAGVTPMPLPNEENFIPYTDLTEQLIIEWLETIADKPHMQQQIVKEITKMLSPIIEDKILPWGNPNDNSIVILP